MFEDWEGEHHGAYPFTFMKACLSESPVFLQPQDKLVFLPVTAFNIEPEVEEEGPPPGE